MSDIWKTCFGCGFKKPPDRLTTRNVNGHRRTLCDNCADDLDSGILVVRDHGIGFSDDEMRYRAQIDALKGQQHDHR